MMKAEFALHAEKRIAARDMNREQVIQVALMPEQRQVYQYHRGDSQVTTYSGGDTMDVEALFPGLELKLADNFAVPDLG